MKALTNDAFQDYLDNELAWRRSEIQALKAEVRRTSCSPGSPAARAASRALSVLVYAHWEGYVKQTFDKLAETVVRRKPAISLAADAWVVSHLRHAISRIQSGDAAALEQMVQLVRGGSAGRIVLRREDLVRTHGNLRHEYLVEILSAFGMDPAVFELKSNFIDSTVCDRRNAIAHGRDSFLDGSAAIQAADSILEMIEDLKEMQIAFLSGGWYLSG